MRNLSLSNLRGPTATVLVVLVLALPALRAQTRATAPKAGSSYRIFWDDKGNVILLAVSPRITEDELRAALKKVADERQDDPARDYLFDRLWVIAYLEARGRCSRREAGRLGRFVPARNPPPSAPPREKDLVTIRLRDARRTMQEGTLSGRGCTPDKDGPTSSNVTSRSTPRIRAARPDSSTWDLRPET